MDLIQLPWSSYTELEHVYRLIYENEDDICSLKEAKNCLIAWSLGSKKATYEREISTLTAFVNAALYDKQRADDLVLQSLYSTALIRFCEMLRNYEFSSDKNRVIRVSYIKNPGKNRAELAESLGLPGWIVDIRHEAAHGDTSSLDLMRKATFLAMDWLSLHFWTIVLDVKRIDRQVDGIIEHVFSDVPVVDMRAKTELFNLMRGASHATVKFAVRSLLKATAVSDLTLHRVDPKTSLLIEVIVECGHIHLLLHNLIDHFEDEDSEKRSAAILWFAELLKGMTTKSSRLSHHLSRYSNAENVRIPEIEIHFMKVLNHLLMSPSEVALAYVPCFKKIIPGKAEVIDRVREAMATLLGVGLSRGPVAGDYQMITIEDIKKGIVAGETSSKSASKRSPVKRPRRC